MENQSEISRLQAEVARLQRELTDARQEAARNHLAAVDMAAYIRYHGAPDRPVYRVLTIGTCPDGKQAKIVGYGITAEGALDNAWPSEVNRWREPAQTQPQTMDAALITKDFFCRFCKVES